SASHATRPSSLTRTSDSARPRWPSASTGRRSYSALETTAGAAPAAVSSLAIRNVVGVTFEYRNEPVSVWSAVKRFIAMSAVISAGHAVSNAYTISPVAAADGSTQFTRPH